MKSIIALLIVFAFSYVVAQDELSLFDAQGQASAYIVADDNMTIYLWSGEPVAYLVKDNGRDSPLRQKAVRAIRQAVFLCLNLQISRKSVLIAKSLFLSANCSRSSKPDAFLLPIKYEFALE